MTQLWEYFIDLEVMIMKKPQRTQYMKYIHQRIMSPLSKSIHCYPSTIFFFYIHNFNMIIYLVSKSIALYTTHVSGMIYHANSHFQITTVIVPRVRDDELQISNVLGLQYGGQTIYFIGMFQKIFQCKKNISALLAPDDSMFFS